MNKSTQVVAFTVRITKADHDRLTQLAASSDRSLGAEARRAIVAYLHDMERRVA